MKDNKLEVGDELYYTGNSGDMFYEGKIDRVTKTMAFIGKKRYQIEMENGSTRNPGQFEYHTKWFRLLDNDIKAELHKQRARCEAEKILVGRFENNIYEATHLLTDSQLSRIIGILEEGK